MKLCADILYWRLKEKLTTVTQRGKGGNALTLNRPEFYLDRSQTFEKNRVYVCSADHLPQSPKLGEDVCLICLGQHWNLSAYYDRCSVILVEGNWDIFRVFNLVQEIFNRYDGWEEQLWTILRHGGNLPQMLDCMAVAGCAGIAVGRLACFFNSADRGQIITSTQSLPWVYPVTNAVSGATEYRLATFILQAMAALVLFLILLSFYLPKKQRKDGDTALIFLLFYGASQIVLDSTRYDKLFFRSNGFVSVVQVLGALGLLLVIVVFSLRMVKARGFRFWNVLVWLGIAACIGGAGFMEYYVQRHGDLAAFSYSIMSACLLAAAGLVLLLRRLAQPVRRRR